MDQDDNQKAIPADYLNQIAPKQQNKFDFLKQKSIMIAIIALLITLIFTVLIGVISMNKPSITKNLERLAAKLLSTQEITKEADKNIKSSKLLSINSNLNIILTNTIRDITPLLDAQNININKLNEDIEKLESNAEILARLEDARLNVKYDISYAGEMTTQLENTMILIKQMYKTTKNDSIKSFLDNSYNNIEQVQEQFAKFNPTN